MLRRPLGNTGIEVSPLGLGTVKFGRNTAVDYPRPIRNSERRFTSPICWRRHNTTASTCWTPRPPTGPARHGSAKRSKGAATTGSSAPRPARRSTAPHHTYDFGEDAILQKRREVPGAIANGYAWTSCWCTATAAAVDLIESRRRLPRAIQAESAKDIVRAVGFSGKTVARRPKPPCPECGRPDVHHQRQLSPDEVGIAEPSSPTAGVGVLVKKPLARGLPRRCSETIAETA